MRMVLALVALTACAGTEPTLESRLDGMTTTTLRYEDRARGIVESSMGMPADSARIRWVVGQMPSTPDGATINGAAIECDIWISWFGDQWKSGASKDGPAISTSAFAHEMAHCALWLSGDADANHARADWWASGGRVETANAALADAGL